MWKCKREIQLDPEPRRRYRVGKRGPGFRQAAILAVSFGFLTMLTHCGPEGDPVPKPGGGDVVGPAQSCPIDQIGGGVLILGRVPPGGGGGVLLYSAEFGGGLPSTCVNRVESFRNQTAFDIAIVEMGTAPDGCLGSSVRLAPLQESTPGDVSKVFGERHPMLPVSFAACVFAGGDPPLSLSLTITYRTTSE